MIRRGGGLVGLHLLCHSKFVQTQKGSAEQVGAAPFSCPSGPPLRDASLEPRKQKFLRSTWISTDIG